MKAIIIASLLAASMFPLGAAAQAPAQSPVGGGETSALAGFAWSILPLVAIAAVFIVFIRRTQRPIIKRTQEHMAKQAQHMARVEQLLERIAKAVEKQD